MHAATAGSIPALPTSPRSLYDDDDFWTSDPTCFDVDLDCGQTIGKIIGDFEKNKLSHKTSLKVITASRNASNALEVDNFILNDKEAVKLNNHATSCFQLLSISKILPEEDQWRFRIRPTVLRHLTASYHIPTAFVASIARSYGLCGTSFRRQSQHHWDYWCLLPMRVSIDCMSGPAARANSAAGSNQMDAFNYIHLEGEAQVERSLGCRSATEQDDSPCFVLLIYTAFILRRWNSVLLCFCQEVVAHGKRLQQDISNETENFIDDSKTLNVSLHIMAAHLHRYKTELRRIGMVLSDRRTHREAMTDSSGSEETKENESSFPEIDRELQKIEQLDSQLTAMSNFSDEVEKKVQNILALVSQEGIMIHYSVYHPDGTKLFIQIQAVNDKTLQAILNASQQETRISQRLSLASHMLSKSMKRDSIAMKTIAIMTLLFLPGATLAAVFAMPFFAENDSLSKPSQIWVWAVVTVICTLFAFCGYLYVVYHGKGDLEDPEVDTKLNH
ncbi:hypothetical protein B0T10DRAFT_605179 [Thelonectria olida]|uniref:Uncharacterized protein n=1 Tax=Thelonectria olida TaxID=1576542 RepID=A0A9P8WAB3_9HYPO|nr:hypothetical protein B0T10DRAFT_605179 [Thelonectria olida]